MKITVFSKISGTPCLGLDSFTFVTLSCKTEWKQCFCRFMCSFFFCHVFSNNRIGLIRTVVLSAEKGWMTSLWCNMLWWCHRTTNPCPVV